MSYIQLMLKQYIKRLVFKYTSFGKPRYNFGVEPIQLTTIINTIEKVASRKSSFNFFEIGVARGLTTRFVAEHIRNQHYNCDYYCIDTFSSFTASDLLHETEQRGKTKQELIGFNYNDFETWKNNFKEFPFIKPIQSDAKSYNFNQHSCIDIVFLDVDLYKPTQHVLAAISDLVQRGSTIIVDDVKDNNSWDGAYQAFMEHVNAHGLSYSIIGNKCGVISI